MTLLDLGLNRTRDLLFADITKGQLGTGGTASTPSDTGLNVADATSLLALLKKTNSDKQTKWDYRLPSTGGTTVTYKEFELVGNSDVTSYDRIVFTGIAFVKNGTQDLLFTKRYFYKSV